MSWDRHYKPLLQPSNFRLNAKVWEGPRTGRRRGAPCYMVPINSNKFLIPSGFGGGGGGEEDDDGVAPARSGQIPRVRFLLSAVLSVCRWPNGLTPPRMLGDQKWRIFQGKSKYLMS